MTDPLLPKNNPTELTVEALEIEQKPQEINEIEEPKNNDQPMQLAPDAEPQKANAEWIKFPDLTQLKKYEPTIEFDTYILSALLSGFFIPCTIIYIIFQILGIVFLSFLLVFLPCCFCFKLYYTLIWKTLAGTICFAINTVLVYILLVPGIFVTSLQIIALQFLENIKNVDNIEYNNMLFLKVGIVIIYICMVSKELSQGLNTFFYIVSLCLKIKRNKDYCGLFFGILSLIMPFIQIMTVVFLCRISIQIILSSETTLDLVQNFAGLYVILEFDNIMYAFISLLPWRTFLQFVVTIEVFSISMNGMAHPFLCIFFKELLNLQNDEEESIENQNEKPKKEDDPEKGKEENTEVKNDEKHVKPLLPGEDQDDFKFSYNDAFGEKAKYFISFKVIVMLGLILFWIFFYVTSIIDSTIAPKIAN